jgi:hypothetical protein
MKKYRGVEVFLISALVGGEWPASLSGRFTPVERALGTHWIGGLVDPKTGLEEWRGGNRCPYRVLNFDPSTVQPLASRYTD